VIVKTRANLNRQWIVIAFFISVRIVSSRS